MFSDFLGTTRLVVKNVVKKSSPESIRTSAKVLKNGINVKKNEETKPLSQQRFSFFSDNSEKTDKPAKKAKKKAEHMAKKSEIKDPSAKKPEESKPKKKTTKKVVKTAEIIPIEEEKSKPEIVIKGPKLALSNNGLVIDKLGKSYGGRPVVRDVSLEINRGEAIGLLGPNGAGKTTCFYMIMGLIKPDYGTIKLDGQNVAHLPVYRRARLGIGYLPQEASIFRGLSVEDNILSVLEVCEPIAERRATKLESLLAEFSITHLRRSPAIALSGGERRRVEIARALASNPSFILLDEPLAGVDPVAIADIKELIFHLKDRNIGVLITDHNVRETLDLIDRAYILHGGSVLMHGTPKEIIGNEDVRRVYLGKNFKL